MTHRLSGRLARLTRGRGAGACAGRTTCILTKRHGDPDPPLPPDAVPCACGEHHIMLVEEVLVSSREEVADLRRRAGERWVAGGATP